MVMLSPLFKYRDEPSTPIAVSGISTFLSSSPFSIAIIAVIIFVVLAIPRCLFASCSKIISPVSAFIITALEAEISGAA